MFTAFVGCDFLRIVVSAAAGTLPRRSMVAVLPCSSGDQYCTVLYCNMGAFTVSEKTRHAPQRPSFAFCAHARYKGADQLITQSSPTLVNPANNIFSSAFISEMVTIISSLPSKAASNPSLALIPVVEEERPNKFRCLDPV